MNMQTQLVLADGRIVRLGTPWSPLPQGVTAPFVALLPAHNKEERLRAERLAAELHRLDCFETFPFPPGWQCDPNLEAVGQQYYDFRATLMQQRGEGLTKIYNRFHDPNEQDPQIDRLRELHAAMDRAVLTAYGFTDLPTTCDFILDYEIDEATGTDSPRRVSAGGDKKKPYRYRWPDSVRDEVLARLLDLNKQRHQAESLSGQLASPEKSTAAKPAPPKPKKPKAPPKAKAQPEGTLALFGPKPSES